MKLQYCLPSPEHVVRFILPKSLSREDWLMCSACGLPQKLYRGCCFDPDCEPHAFRVDPCIHCGFDFHSDADPKGYDVKKGKAEHRHSSWRRMQRDAIRQYEEYCREPEYPDADGT